MQKLHENKGRFQKVWNFFHKNMVLKCLKLPKYSFESNLFFQYGVGLTLKIYLRSKWLLDLPDLGIFLSILDFLNGKN